VIILKGYFASTYIELP